MQEMINRFIEKGMLVELQASGFKDGNVIYDKTIHFPEVRERGMFLLGKVSGNDLTVHQRVGMNGYNFQLGNMHLISDDTLDVLKEQYDSMKRIIERMKEF